MIPLIVLLGVRNTPSVSYRDTTNRMARKLAVTVRLSDASITIRRCKRPLLMITSSGLIPAFATSIYGKGRVVFYKHNTQTHSLIQKKIRRSCLLAYRIWIHLNKFTEYIKYCFQSYLIKRLSQKRRTRRSASSTFSGQHRRSHAVAKRPAE